MRTSYVAYGLQFDSFALPGMTPQTARGLPALELRRCTPGELDSRWSGPNQSSVWRGRVGDGTRLLIEGGKRGDVLFTYGARARYRLDRAGEKLQCAPREEGLRWRQVLLARILPNVAIARGYEALHASAVESPAGVVAIAAPSGTGKTTLALELTRRDWPLVTDDVLVLEDGPEGVFAHPGPPHANVADSRLSEEVCAEIGLSLAIHAGERWVALRVCALEARPVCAVCLLRRGPGLRLEARPLSGGQLPLLPHMLGLRGDASRERRRFSTYANLAAGASLLELTCSPTDGPAAVAEVLERAIMGSPVLASGRATS
jgi:hypothetical protein